MSEQPKIIYPVNSDPQLNLGAAGYPIHKEVATYITRLESDLAAAIKERDEAREEYGHAVATYSFKQAQLETRDEQLAESRKALEISPYDMSPCMECHKQVICLPDGMPMCVPCGEKEAAK